MWTYNNTDELYHYGVLGMKWGVRRYQNKDGSLTAAGKKQRYGMSKRQLKKTLKKADRTNRDRVEDEYQKEFKKHKLYNELGKKENELAKKIIKLYDDDMTKLYNGEIDELPEPSKKLLSLHEQHKAVSDKMTKIEIEVGKRYVEKFNDAKLQDIKYSKSAEVGREMLNAYHKAYEMRYDGYILDGYFRGAYPDNDYIRPWNMD